MIFWKKKAENTITAEELFEYKRTLAEVSEIVQENLDCLQTMLKIPEKDYFKLGYLIGVVYQKLSEDRERLFSIRYSLWNSRK